MRDAIRELTQMPGKSGSGGDVTFEFGKQISQHLGLTYDVYAPVVAHSDDREESGRVHPDVVDPWLDAIVGGGEGRAVEPAAGYRDFLDVWRSSFDDTDEVVMFEMNTDSRLLVGHGYNSGSQVGLTFHHTWGVPIIPGSAIKGLLYHYVVTTYGPNITDMHPASAEHPEPERTPFQGVTWDEDQILHGPGEFIRTIFGAPDAASDDELRGELGEAAAVGATRGEFLFYDALLADTDGCPLARDVLTVHQKEYYNSRGGQSPSDYDAPNPVQFLTVKPDTKFLFTVAGPSDWLSLVIELLENALSDWGVGGKTSAGYGRFNDDTTELTRQPYTPVIEDWLDNVASEPDEAADFAIEVENEWRANFESDELNDRQKALVWRACKDYVIDLKTQDFVEFALELMGLDGEPEHRASEMCRRL